MDTLPDLPFPVSFTQLNDYITCPKKFFHRYLAKDCPQEVKSRQQNTGIELHDAIKRRFKLHEPLPREFEHHERTCASILTDGESTQHVELGLGCTADGRPCGFFDPGCRLRSRLDFVAIRPLAAVIIDWKTGKPWEDPFELNVQGLLLKIHYPELETIRGFYWWLRSGKPGPTYTIDIAKAWEKISHLMAGIEFRLYKNNWPPDEGPLCPWCPVTKEMCAFKKDPK
jgi:PD-(D/E)XK nuclease superfamily